MSEKWQYQKAENENLQAALTTVEDKLFDARASEDAAWKRVATLEKLWMHGPPRQWPIGLHWRRLAKALVAEHGEQKALDYLSGMLRRELIEVSSKAARLDIPSMQAHVDVEDLAFSLIIRA